MAGLKSLRGEDLVAALINSFWYPREDDLIGGWCIMPVDAPPSSGGPQVGTFLGEGTAKHICTLHNEWLEAKNNADSK